MKRKSATFQIPSDRARSGASASDEAAPQRQPDVFFEGRCDEALSYYRTALGAEVTMLIRYDKNPESQSCGMCGPIDGGKIMHVSFRIGDNTIMASDGRCSGEPAFQGFSLSLTVADEAQAARLFAALADGGQVQLPLARTFFASRFGMVSDRFGVCWMILVPPAAES